MKSSVIAVALVGFLAAAAPASAAVPNPAGHNHQYNGSFTYNGQTCNFAFQYGNYGVGYTQLWLGNGCWYSVVSLVSYKNGAYYQAARPVAPWKFGQATALAGNLLEAQYCVSSGNASLMFRYNALNNYLSFYQVTPNGECY